MRAFLTINNLKRNVYRSVVRQDVPKSEMNMAQSFFPFQI
jgi:hypothetical protein